MFNKLSLAALALVVSASAAMATPPTPFETLYDSSGMDGIQTTVQAGAAIIVAIATVWVGIKLVRRLLNRA